MIIKLSDHVTLRPQQINWFHAYFTERKRFFLTAAHRRFGKGLAAFMMMMSAAIERRGIYGYFLPTIGQSRKVVWQTIGEDGRKLVERIPSKLIAGINNSEQMITTSNGSIIYISGSDNYERWVGLNFCYLVFDEAQDTNFAAWDAFRPMITRNKGFTHFLGTCRAFTRFKELYFEHKDDPEWFVTNLTVDDTYDQYGKRIITEEDIEAERRNGMPEELIRQEYFGDWNATIRGAYFTEQLQAARKEGRIGHFPYNPQHPVYTGWDLGYDDDTAIWFIQSYNNKLYLIDYEECRAKGMQYYAGLIHGKLREYKQFQIHFAPHDIENHDLGPGKSRKSQALEMGLRFNTVPAPSRKIHGIQCIRHMFPRMHFNEAKIGRGLKHLSESRPSYDEKNQVYSLNPLRNDATHGVDSLQTFCIGFMKAYEPNTHRKQVEIANLYGVHIW